MKIEKWNGQDIRFVLVDGEWWAVAKDVAKVLGYKHTPHMVRMLDQEEKSSVHLTDSTQGGNPNTTIISETGIYEAIFRSKRKEATEFKKWVKQILKALRKQTGLEGFQVFLMMDKDHQKQAMEKISQLKKPTSKHYIKANTIANKITSSLHGYPKMVKKGDMTPEMLQQRQPILEDTVELMRVKEEYNLDISVSQSVKDKWLKQIN